MTNTANTVSPAVDNFIKAQALDQFFSAEPSELKTPELFDKIRDDDSITDLLAGLTVNHEYECTEADDLAKLVIDEYWRLKYVAIESIKLNVM